MFLSHSERIYVRILENAFDVCNVDLNLSGYAVAEQPFSSIRLAIASFEAARSTLELALKQVYRQRWLKAAPQLIMHQLHLSQGGLSEVELRVLHELALAVGAKHVFLWQGNTLSREQLLNNAYRS